MNSEGRTGQIWDSFLFPQIFKTFRMAIQPSKFFIAFLALFVIAISGWIMDLTNTVATIESPAPGTTGVYNELQIYVQNPQAYNTFMEMFEERGGSQGVFTTVWHFTAARFHDAINDLFSFDISGVVTNAADMFRMLLWMFRYHFVYSLIFGLIVLAALSLAGGAICRISALQLARGEKPGFMTATKYSTIRFLSLFGAPLTPVIIILCIGLLIFVMGLIGNIPWVGELLVGLSLLPMLVIGAVMTVLIIGTIAGFNLMFPAVAYNGSDSFDSLSRSISYIYTKPWHMGFYTAVAGIYGVICYLFVRFFAFLMLQSTHWFLRLGIFTQNSAGEVNKLNAIWPEPLFANLLGGRSPDPSNWSESVAAFLIYIVPMIVIGVVVSFIISFFFSANTVIYALMRKKVDSVDFDEINADLEQISAEVAIAEEVTVTEIENPETDSSEQKTAEENKPSESGSEVVSEEKKPEETETNGDSSKQQDENGRREK